MDTKVVKEELIEYWKNHLIDLIPYDTPNYEEVLQKEAEKFADIELEPLKKMNYE